MRRADQARWRCTGGDTGALQPSAASGGRSPRTRTRGPMRRGDCVRL